MNRRKNTASQRFGFWLMQPSSRCSKESLFTQVIPKCADNARQDRSRNSPPGDGVSGAIVLGELAHTNAVMSPLLITSRCDNRHGSRRIGPCFRGFVTCITWFSDETLSVCAHVTLHWFRTASRHAEFSDFNTLTRSAGARNPCCVDCSALSCAGSGHGLSTAAIARPGA